MKEKMENDAAALMRSVVSKRGRNVEVAESTVRQSKSFTEQEALIAEADRLRRAQRTGLASSRCRAKPSNASTGRPSP